MSLLKNELFCLVHIHRFLQTRPSRPDWSSNRNVYVNIYMFPFHVIYFEASHWPSGQMISSRPLSGQPSTLPKTPLSAFNYLKLHETWISIMKPIIQTNVEIIQFHFTKLKGFQNSTFNA